MAGYEDWTELSHEYIFVVDTNQISYGFYKELCAYCTGFFHDDLPIDGNDFYVDLGIDEDEDDEISNPLLGCVIRKHLAEDDCDTPCSVWLNKRYGCDESGNFEVLDESNFETFCHPAPMSVGIFMEVHPTQEQINLIKRRSHGFCARRPELGIEIEGFRIIQHVKLGKDSTVA